ncbi:MAG: hypothetical protein NVSMB39_0210 [Candidatus Saccharimonadales bacterium]
MLDMTAELQQDTELAVFVKHDGRLKAVGADNEGRGREIVLSGFVVEMRHELMIPLAV